MKHAHEKEKITDAVNLSPRTAEALNALGIVEHVGRVNIDLHTMAWVTLVLRFLPDDGRFFFRGKWATIQHIQEQLEEAAEAMAEVIVTVKSRESLSK